MDSNPWSGVNNKNDKNNNGPASAEQDLHQHQQQQQQQQELNQFKQLSQESRPKIETDDEDSSEDFNIARRTRSHVRIDDFVLNDNLDFPDVDKSLYQNPDSVTTDPEYKNFLYQCYSNPVELSADTNSEDNDPPYIHNDDIFSHGWKFDLDEELFQQQQIQREEEEEEEEAKEEVGQHDRHLQEASERLTELIEVPVLSELQKSIITVAPQATCVVVDANYDPTNTDLISSFSDHKSAVASLSSVPGFKSPHKSGLAKRRIDYFENPEFKRVLNQQLRQHVQLLTQTYLLASCMTNMHDEAAEAKSHLNSYMKIFRNRRKPSNLLPAIKLVTESVAPKELKSSVRLSWRQLPVPDMAKKIIDQHPNVFPYAELLPQVAFSVLPEKLVTKKPKIIFTPNEDKLLALALKEFENEYAQYAYIASLLMAAKTKMQINNHVKNMKRSPGNEDNPIRLFISQGQLPQVDLNSDTRLRDYRKPPTPEPAAQETTPYNQCESDMMNMDLDDLMAATTTISKNNPYNSGGCNSNGAHNTNTSTSEKNIRNQRLRKSMLNLMSHKFALTQDMGELIVQDFLKTSREKLEERDYMHLLHLMTDIMRNQTQSDPSSTGVMAYQEISRFLKKIEAPSELLERLILFLDLDQATKCGCALQYLHWMRFFQFIQHVEMHHESEVLEKKLIRLIDAIQKDDPHKVRLATVNLINKHPLLKSEYEALSLEGKPHQSLFVNEEDFDDITEPLALYDNNREPNDKEDKVNHDKDSLNQYEHFDHKLTQDELNFASQSCPCSCHKETVEPSNNGTNNLNNSNGNNNHLASQQQLGQHCNKCNLKFMKGRMYLVNKIKPFLAEWAYIDRPQDSLSATTSPANKSSALLPMLDTPLPDRLSPHPPASLDSIAEEASAELQWTFEEDKEILEFCRTKAEQNDENVSFDSTTFEELVRKRRSASANYGSSCKKGAKEIAERFNHLMEMYRRDDGATATLGI